MTDRSLANSVVGAIVAFPRPRGADNRLGVGDRIELLRWSDSARSAGVRRVALERPDPDDDPATVGDFVLIYGEDAQWARWGVARQAGAYEVWRPADGRSSGRFASLREALAAIHPAE
jgi:hypothetical protein